MSHSHKMHYGTTDPATKRSVNTCRRGWASPTTHNLQKVTCIACLNALGLNGRVFLEYKEENRIP